MTFFGVRMPRATWSLSSLLPNPQQKLDSSASAVSLAADPVLGGGKRNATPSDVDAVLCGASGISKCFAALPLAQLWNCVTLRSA